MADHVPVHGVSELVLEVVDLGAAEAFYAGSNAVAFAGSKYVLFEQERLGPQGSARGNADFLDLYVARTGELVWSGQLPGPAGNWDHGESGYLYISPDAKTIVAGGAETGHVSFYRGSVKTHG